MSLQNKKPLLTSPDEHSSAGVSRNISMRKVLYAILACLFFVSAAPVFADGGPEGSAVVSASPPFTPGGNPGQITEEDSVKQSDTNNSMLQYSLSVPDGFGLLEARSEEHTSELQSHSDLVCRLLLEKRPKTARCKRAVASG